MRGLTVEDCVLGGDRNHGGADMPQVRCWVAFDVHVSGVVACHTGPEHGVYREVTVNGRGQSLSPRYLSECTVAVDDLLAD